MMWDRRRSSERRQSLQCPFIRCSSREWCVDVHRGPREWSSSHLWRRDRDLLAPSDSEHRDGPELVFSPPTIREQLAQPCPRCIPDDDCPAPGSECPRPQCVREGGVRVQGGVNIRIAKRQEVHAHTVPDQTTERGMEAGKRTSGHAISSRRFLIQGPEGSRGGPKSWFGLHCRAPRLATGAFELGPATPLRRTSTMREESTRIRHA